MMFILIADDEKPARGELRFILEQFAGSATFLEATNGQEALELTAAHPIDVVFLDINMPGVNGLAAAAAIIERPDPPYIVFATAYDAHAVRAFELAALDYVVKPFHEERLAQTVLRIRQAISEKEGRRRQKQSLQQMLEQAAQPRLTKLWALRSNESRLLLDYEEIFWFEARDKKVYCHTGSGEPLQVRGTLKELADRLETHNFMRVHKGFLVNLSGIFELVPWFSGTYQIRMNDPAHTEIPLSRQYAQQLKERTGLF